MSDDIEAVIGLEVHCQLATESKIFSSARARMREGVSVGEEAVNRNVNEVCAGHPGSLPVLNKKAVEYAVKAGLATHCQIQLRSIFARKNYFYPDLPKGYQISQYDEPICTRGWLSIPLKEGEKKIGITRIHMEEDAGKNVHESGFSLVNLNRAGVPLIEIVSEPELRTPEEAGLYLRALYAIVTYLDICDGNLQEGNFRCDANVSIRPRGQMAFGTRTEIKNINSFKFVEQAIEYEIARQIDAVQSGQRIIQETRGFDSQKGTTYSMRSKEDAQDYRYFPDPDLPPMILDAQWVEQLRQRLPELPMQKKSRYRTEFGLGEYDADLVTSNKVYAQFFEQALSSVSVSPEKSKNLAKTISNYMTGELLRLLGEEGISLEDSKIKPSHLADLSILVLDEVVSSTGAKSALAEAYKTGESIESIVQKNGLKQVSDLGALEAIVDQVITQNAAQWAEFKSGKEKVLGFLVGQAMKLSQGKGNPAKLQEIFKKK